MSHLTIFKVTEDGTKFKIAIRNKLRPSKEVRSLCYKPAVRWYFVLDDSVRGLVV